MSSRPMFPPISLAPESFMGDLFRITRALGPALPYLSESQISVLREQAALFELYVDRRVVSAQRYEELIGTLESEPLVEGVLPFRRPAREAGPSVATPTRPTDNPRPTGTKVRQCLECHRRFETRRPTHIYCSAKCRYESWDRAHPRQRGDTNLSPESA